MTFTPYVNQGLTFDRHSFDFLITNEVAQDWYARKDMSGIAEIQWCASQLTQGMTVVDCGAHHGLMSVIFAKCVGPGGKVFAYEVLPQNAAVVEDNARLNQLGNIVVRPVGLSDQQTTVRTVVHGGNMVVTEERRIAPDQVENGRDRIESLDLVRLDDDLPIGERVDFLKLDVEGSDLPALKGMGRTLLQRPILDLELHNFLFRDGGETLAEIIALLDPLDYSWALLGLPGDSPTAIDGLAVNAIAAFDNPHLFGRPNHR